IENSLAKNDQGKINGAGNVEGLAQLLLADDLFPGAAERAESSRQFIKLIIEGQQPDGSWKAGGQLPSQKRPAAETAEVSTMWAGLALVPQTEQQAELDKAIKRLDASPAGKSTEWYAARLLLATRLGNKPQATALIEKLHEQQQADGGWGWVVGEE